jgi:hypothetical protein
MKERMKRHEERNAARKLTPEQRREKKRRKLFENTSLMTRVAVFRVPYRALIHPKIRFKVDINASQYYLSGVALLCEDKDSPEATFGLVCVEGGPKAIRRYKKLMLRRIKWDIADDQDTDASSTSTHSETKLTSTTNTTNDSDDSDEDEKSSEQSSSTQSYTSNSKCLLVWEVSIFSVFHDWHLILQLSTIQTTVSLVISDDSDLSLSLSVCVCVCLFVFLG